MAGNACDFDEMPSSPISGSKKVSATGAGKKGNAKKGLQNNFAKRFAKK